MPAATKIKQSFIMATVWAQDSFKDFKRLSQRVLWHLARDMSWSCSVCTKKNGPDAEVCVTCMRPRGHKPESAQLKRALDPSRDGERRRERMGFDFEPEDVDGDTGFIGWSAVLSTVVAVVALIGAVRRSFFRRRRRAAPPPPSLSRARRIAHALFCVD